MRKKWFALALLGACIGAIAASISLANHARIVRSVSISKNSFCTVSDFVNCDAVEASSYSTVGGAPIAGLGLFYYLMIGGLALYARFRNIPKFKTAAFCWWSTIPAVLYSILLAFISIYVLHAVCLTCITMYIANLILFIAFTGNLGLHGRDWFRFIRDYWISVFTRRKGWLQYSPSFWVHFLISVLVFGIGYLFSGNVSGTFEIKANARNIISRYLDEHFASPVINITFDKGNTPVWGNPNAPVTIVEFSDYVCPYCRVAAFLIKPFISEYKKDVAFYFVNYPLDAECNSYMQSQMHPGACLAAKAALCAHREGRFWEMHDRLFKLKEVSRDEVVSAAKECGLDIQKFEGCLSDPSIEKKVREDIELGRSIHIRGTPSVFVNGRELGLVLDKRSAYFRLDPYFIREVIKRELKAVHK